MDLGLKGRAYLVTGSSRGLGFATAAALTAESAEVCINGRDASAVERAVKELGARAHGVAADNTDPATADSLVRAVLDRFGRLDGAFISTGGPAPSTAMETSDEMWRCGFESVFLGPVRLARRCIAALGDGGAVGLVLSSSVRSPIPRLALSNGLRPALAMTAKTLADEVGHQGIRVFGLMPGRIATDRVTEAERADPALRERRNVAIPLGRMGRPEEFGRVAAFLLSPAASYITGCVVPVDGGMIRAL
jgi:3-oxoacyl-[acyl-carrier protein] reductase